MKKVFIFLLNLIVISVFAQAPLSIKYQAVARDISGNILLNQNISMRISLLDNAVNGNMVYSETHQVATNSYGLVNLEIGLGNVQSGNFSTIDWSKGQYFVQIEADANGGNNFILLGISQLMSVPYSFYSNTAGTVKLTESQRDALVNPAEGMIIYNLTTQCLNFKKTTGWYQLCGECTPNPIQATAGPDTTILYGTITWLAGNWPAQGSTGTWIKISGDGGIIAEVNNPTSMFTGVPGNTYVLRWNISNDCGSTSDEVIIQFAPLPTSFYLLGDATPNGWNIATPIAMDYIAENQFAKTMVLNDGPEGIKFVLSPGSWLYNWGTSATSEIVPGAEYDLIPYGNNILLPDSTEYLIELNLTTNKFKITSTFIPVLPDHLWLIGGSTSAGWDLNAAIPFNQMSDGVFHIYVPLVAGDGFKFLTVPQSYLGDWGQDPQNPGAIIPEGEQNCTIQQDGFYRITVDFNSLQFTAELLNWSILGTAITPESWWFDVPMNYVGGNEPYTWEISNYQIMDGEFKFRANGSWDINFGDNGNDGSLEFFGLNIPITAGVYTIKLILEPNNWHYTANPVTTEPNPCDGNDSILYMGQIYHTVSIGNQCWLRENLNAGTLLAGDSAQTNNGVIEKYCYNNDPENCAVYGGLYKWSEMMQYTTVEGSQGICPNGYHVPTTTEFDTLRLFLGGNTVAGGKMKETGLEHWNAINYGATNESGFTALGAGISGSNGSFQYLKVYAYFWSSTQLSSTNAYFYYLGYNITNANKSNAYSEERFSIRCLKNDY